MEKKIVNELNSLQLNPSETRWKTMGGIFETHQKARVQFKLPEFSHNKTITWNVHIDEHTAPADAQYDMIVGTDLMEELQIKIDYNRRHIEWDDVIVPMKNQRNRQRYTVNKSYL